MTEPKNLHNFARRVSRGSAGTFQSAQAIVQTLKKRLAKDFSEESSQQFSELLDRLEQAEKENYH